jgi:hypothetical protein
VLALTVALQGCFKVNNDFLASRKPEPIFGQLTQFKDVTAAYVKEQSSVTKETSKKYAASTAVKMGEDVYLIVDTIDPSKLVGLPDRFYRAEFYKVGENNYVAAMIDSIHEKGKIEAGPNSGLVFINRYGKDKLIVTPFADAGFLRDAIAGKYDGAPPVTDNPFASIARQVDRVIKSGGAGSDIQGGISRIGSWEDARRIAAAIRTMNYVTDRTLFYEITL